jgi:hypothetical protein
MTSAGVGVGAGDVLTFGKVDQTALAFTVDDDPAWVGALFTLALLDLDNLSPATPAAGTSWGSPERGPAYVHGIWSNLSPGAVATPLNADVITWWDLAPSYGSHRFIAILFEQVGGVADASHMRKVLGYGPGTDTPTNRAFFNTTGFVKSVNLGVADATFFYMPCNKASAEASIVTGLTECTQVGGVNHLPENQLPLIPRALPPNGPGFTGATFVLTPCFVCWCFADVFVQLGSLPDHPAGRGVGSCPGRVPLRRRPPRPVARPAPRRPRAAVGGGGPGSRVRGARLRWHLQEPQKLE